MQLRKSNHPSRKNLSPRATVVGFTFRFALRAVFATVFAIAIIAAAAVSEANEHAAPAEEAKPGAASEHGAAGASSAPKIKPACRYSEHESRLTSHMAKIRGLEKEIAEMIEAKHHTENSEKVKLLTQQISFKYSDLRKVVREYEEERLHVRFQHPDRDMEGNRQYSEHRLKSLDEIEAAFGLDGRLDRVRKQVGIVFPISETALPTELRHPASLKPTEGDDEIPSNIRLVK